jgi:hypothetical protein
LANTVVDREKPLLAPLIHPDHHQQAQPLLQPAI